VDGAIARYGEEGLTPRQEGAVERDPRRDASRFRGSRIDEFAKSTVLQDADLAEVISTPDRQFGPDFIDSVLPNWFDITTRRAWQAHIDRYARRYGRQRGILLPTDPSP
jgi:hypothetical protein